MSFQAKFGIDSTWTYLGEVEAKSISFQVSRNAHTDAPVKLEGVRKVPMGGGNLVVRFSTRYEGTDMGTTFTYILAAPAAIYHAAKTLRFTINGTDKDWASAICTGYTFAIDSPNGDMKRTFTFEVTETPLAVMS